MSRMRLTRRTLLAAPALLATPLRARGRDRVTFGTNWIAQAEHGGFYQALADGTYERHGLDVRIVPGGPNVNNRALLIAGSLDFFMGGSLIQAFAAVEQNVPTVVVAAIFQKEPQALLSHPGQGLDRWEDLKSIPLLISRTGEATFFRWMVAAHGFSPGQLRPYTFNSGPFCRDPRVAQQGYVTAEPFAIERACGIRPNVFLLAEYGWDTYSTTIETRIDTLQSRSDVVRRFVEASILGWSTYLSGDGAAGNAAIKRDNADMSDEQIAFSTAKLKEYGIVLSGEAIQLGIGALTEARIQGFFSRMVQAGLVKPDTDWRRSFDPRFVNRGLGLRRG